MMRPFLYSPWSVCAGITLSLSALNAPPVQGAVTYVDGYRDACIICEVAIASALGTITAALEASTYAVGTATGMPPYVPVAIPGHGFPGLSDAVSVAYASHSKHVVAVIGSSTKRLALELRRVPLTRVEQKTLQRESEFAKQADRHNCSTIAYGQSMTQATPTSLATGWKWVQEGSYTPGNALEMDSSEAINRTSNDIDNQGFQQINREFMNLKDVAEAGGHPDASVADILNPAIMVSDHKRVLGQEADEYGISDDERMDYLIRYLSIDTPSQSAAILNSATTPASISEGTRRTMHDMGSGMVLAVMDDVMNSRRSHSTTFGTSYLADAMGEPFSPDLASSDEEFVYRVAKYRQRDSEVLGRILVDHGSALREVTKMEAEQLAIKYQRWKFKRNTNLMLSQVLANELQQEEVQ